MRRYIRRNNDYDMIFIQSSIYSFYTLCFAKHFAKKRPIIFNSQDMFQEVLSQMVLCQEVDAVDFMLCRDMHIKASIITAISEDMKQKLIEQGVPEEKIRVIVNWYDDTSVLELPWDKNRFVEQYNLTQDKFYVQYAGTMGTNFNPEIVLDVAERLKDYSDIEFQMIGNGVRKDKFMNDAQNDN